MSKNFMRQARELQARLSKVQEELGNTCVEASAGGGVVNVAINGQQRLQSVKITPEAVDVQDLGLLEDLILAAVNEAIQKSQQLAEDRLGALTGGFKIPGLM